MFEILAAPIHCISFTTYGEILIEKRHISCEKARMTGLIGSETNGFAQLRQNDMPPLIAISVISGD